MWLSGGPQQRTGAQGSVAVSVHDIRYGRQGGRRTKHVAVKGKPCDVCGLRMVVGQRGRHWTCSPVCPGCHRPVGPDDRNCECPLDIRNRRKMRARRSLGA